jgi:hypothetical protein
MESNMYLQQILIQYQARSLNGHTGYILQLKSDLRGWAGGCYLDIIDSGSRAKGTAISRASDVDYLVSLSSNCHENNGGLKAIYDSLHDFLRGKFNPVRKQNVSFRINLNGLEVDITPARKHAGNTNDHWLHVSKANTWKQTNIQRHISDISNSGRTNEIKIIKIWRELNGLDFPSVYLEYLLLSILSGKSKDPANLADNVWFIIYELKRDSGNPLFSRIVDPANTGNILSDLLTTTEKNTIISRAKVAAQATNWNQIVY